MAHGVDPGESKKLELAEKLEVVANNFEAVSRDWFKNFLSTKSPSYYKRVTMYMDNDVFPYIGKIPISELEPPDVYKVIRRIAERGVVDSAHRAKQSIGQVFRYAVVNGLARRDVTADLRGALPPARKKHFPALVEPLDVAGLLNSIENYKGTFVVRSLLKLSPLVMLRPSEVRGVEWSELDFENKVWVIPILRMKAPTEVKNANEFVHLIPLSEQSIEIFKEIKLLTGHRKHVFVGQRDPRKTLSDAAFMRLCKPTHSFPSEAPCITAICFLA